MAGRSWTQGGLKCVTNQRTLASKPKFSFFSLDIISQWKNKIEKKFESHLKHYQSRKATAEN